MILKGSVLPEKQTNIFFTCFAECVTVLLLLKLKTCYADLETSFILPLVAKD